MKTYQDILNKYHQADASVRLFLYLDYPDLRAEFSTIEMSGHDRPRKKTRRGLGFGGKNLFCRFHSPQKTAGKMD